MRTTIRYYLLTSLVVIVAITAIVAALFVKRADHDFEVRSISRGSLEAGHLA